MNKYQWFKHTRIWYKRMTETYSFAVLHTEENIETIIAVTDSAEKADFIVKACNQFDIEKYEESESNTTKA